MTEPSHAASMLVPKRTYRQMLAVGVIGVALLGALGWVASRAPAQPTASRPVEMLSLVSGSIKEVSVNVGDDVNQGDVLLHLADAAEQQELADARADLEKIAAETQAAGIAVALPPSMGLGGKIVTTGPMRGIPVPPPARSAAPKGEMGTLPPAEGPADAHSGAPTTSQTDTDKQLATLRASVESEKSLAAEARHKAEEAAVAGQEAEKNAAAGKGIAEQRKREAEKMRMLLGEGVVSQVETSRAEALAASAQGGYEAALRQAEEFAKRRDDLLAEASKHEVLAQDAQKDLESLKKAPPAKAETAIIKTPRHYLSDAKPDAVRQPAFVQRDPAPPTPAKVMIDKSAKEVADKRMEAAKERFDRAEQAVSNKLIRSPQAGRVKAIRVRVGDEIRPGTVLIEFEAPQKSNARTGPSGG